MFLRVCVSELVLVTMMASVASDVVVTDDTLVKHTSHIVLVQSNQQHDDRSETHAQNLKH